MSADIIGTEIREVLARLIIAGLSVQQSNPSIKEVDGGCISIGDLPVASAAMKNVQYEMIYQNLEANSSFHTKLIDGGLVSFQYLVSPSGNILKHRLSYFPSFALPTIEEAPDLYENDELFAEIMLQRLVRFPIRIDFSPAQHVDVDHPQCHLTLGQFDSCRIPVSGPVGPLAFTLFLLRNFYRRSYIRHKNVFDKRVKRLLMESTITAAERRITHLVVV
ncbi:DUF2290 domain-containing protein [Variovorax beijingensis]|uniref:DUF2290 domain-containing protein n=1 Tax=Variovorax beijingensis TaxID=2496117 RepID=A0A3P3E3G9_9BURK|nr:DUF2290 domain-containing protein [Variovorax beijingensis]RRH80824.1 DUF2290 domain-containing protein [Variovorax beijingensis]